jgi:hypothetical protein
VVAPLEPADPLEVATPRLWLRPLTPPDADAVFRYRCDPEVGRYQN